MINRTTKLRWRRRLKQRKKQVEEIGYQTEENLERHFFKRINKLAQVRRFVLSWLLLLVLLIGGLVTQIRALDDRYLTPQPVPGGIFVEGILGAFTNANPMYATGPADGAVARLVFAGLMKYDENNKLTYDLAEKWSLDSTGKIYTVTLKEGLQWHDGQPLSSQDVVFTYQTIQNPNAKSPLRINWQGVIVEAKGPRTITFTLPNTLSAFPHSLTNGIVPHHILKDIDPAQMRSIQFNTFNPIGSGPFKWESIQVEGSQPETREEQVGLVPFENYHGSRPKLQRFLVRVFRDEQKMIDSFLQHELNAVAGLESIPEEVLEMPSLQEYNIPLTSQVLAFFKVTQEPFNDQKVRQALVRATNNVEIVQSLGYPALVSKSPLLPDHVGYNKDLVQLPHSVNAANKLLDEAGWVMGPGGIRAKGDRKLVFTMHTKSDSEYASVAQLLQKQWKAVGIEVEVILQNANDLQTTIAQHTYESLLYGISLGADPDVFPYWHSTQATSRSGSWLNFSEYQSGKADGGLEGGRTRDDPAVRVVKYQPFLEAWREDAPAVALYQPRFLYLSRGEIHNFSPRTLNQPTDRYNGIENWMIREAKTLE